MAETKEKERNVEEDVGTTLALLNEFCCFTILELLPLAELYVMSRTSTRFEALSAGVFCRRYPNKAIVIDNISDKGKVQPGFQEKYVKYFTKYIPNVILSFGKDPTRDLDRLSKLYDGINGPIKSIEFKKWEAKLEASHGVTMKGIVENIESVTFTEMEIDGDVLQFMTNMKSLTFRQTRIVDSGWMEKEYPKLEYFAWYETSFPVAQLKTLFDRNPTIRHFSVMATLHETVVQLMDSSIRVNDLFIDFDRFKHIDRECSDTLACLLVLCERQPEMRFHMKCDVGSQYYLCQNFDEWKLLSPYIEGLYFQSDEDIDILFDAPLVREFIVNCRNLKVLQLNYDTTIDWVKVTPKLEKVFLYYDLSYNHVMDNVAYQTRRWRNIISSNSETRKLKIYVSSVSSNPTIDRLNDDNDDSVEVIRIETEIVNNPLVFAVFVKERRVKRKRLGSCHPLDTLRKRPLNSNE